MSSAKAGSAGRRRFKQMTVGKTGNKMKEDVLVKIKGLHAMREMPGEDVEVIFPGTCRRLGAAWYIRYDEPVEGFDGGISNLITLRENGIEVEKTGLTSTHMVFEKGKKTETWYETPVGEILLGISALEVSVEEKEESLDAFVHYVLDVGAQSGAECELSMSICGRGE